ncbi:hypothetical protein L1887_50319 [Cichorium endivia]|nr:hypothetical protein L1887_50319 [Cichorium endivia]
MAYRTAHLLQLLLGSELRRVTALALTAVGSTRRETGVALAANLLVACEQCIKRGCGQSRRGARRSVCRFLFEAVDAAVDPINRDSLRSYLKLQRMFPLIRCRATRRRTEHDHVPGQRSCPTSNYCSILHSAKFVLQDATARPSLILLLTVSAVTPFTCPLSDERYDTMRCNAMGSMAE